MSTDKSPPLADAMRRHPKAFDALFVEPEQTGDRRPDHGRGPQ